MVTYKGSLFEDEDKKMKTEKEIRNELENCEQVEVLDDKGRLQKKATIDTLKWVLGEM